jgi:hypothetical protein
VAFVVAGWLVLAVLLLRMCMLCGAGRGLRGSVLTFLRQFGGETFFSSRYVLMKLIVGDLRD